MTDTVDFSVFLDANGQIADPCALAKALYAAELAMMAGGTPQKIEFRDRALWLQPANLNALRTMRIEAQNKCAELNGTTLPRRRFAITAGAARSRCL